MSRSPSARAETAKLLKLCASDNFVSFAPEASEWNSLEPLSQAARAYWHSLKPQRYASLTRTINLLFENLFDGSYFRGYLSRNLQGSNNPWQELECNATEAVYKKISAISDSDSPEFDDSYRFTLLGRKLFNNPLHDLVGLLDAGSETSAASMITHLQQMPALIKHHRPDFDYSKLSESVRNSIGPSWRSASGSTNQLAAIQLYSSKEPRMQIWQQSGVQLNPEAYKAVEHADGTLSLNYNNIGAQQVSELDATFLFPGQAVSPGMLIQDLPSMNGPVIGCPVTFLRGHVHEMWNSLLDTVVEHNLWDHARHGVQ